jgi:hypothetical protein
MEVRFARAMGLTRAEFLRSLPEAVGHRRYRIDGDRIEIADSAGPILILLGPAGVRRIGMLSLPVIRVEFRFGEMSQAQRDRFMTRFERYFQRGGG